MESSRALMRLSLLAVLTAEAATAPPALSADRLHSSASLVASPERDWPQWRGRRRDGISEETGLLQTWPQDGPKLLWKTNGLGFGYSSPIVVDGRMYLTGDVEDELHIVALDLSGRAVWRATNGRAWKGPYPGARATCTYSAGRLYHMNAHGRVACFDAGTGQELWALDMFERFGGKNITWATSENLLVDGSRVFITPGGTRALMAALDKETGATEWASEPLRLGPSPKPAHQRLPEPAGASDNCGYASPILFQLGGRKQIVNCSLRHVFGVDADTGELLWTEPFATRYSVIAATPVLVGNGVLVTAPDTPFGGKLFRLEWAGREIGVDTAWTTPLDTCHGGQVFVDGAIFGSWYRRLKGYACLDPATGQVRYQSKDLGQGSVLSADGRLYCLTQEGVMALLSPTSTGFEMAGRFQLVAQRTSDAWAHPVIVDGRLYLRYHDTLWAFEVRM